MMKNNAKKYPKTIVVRITHEQHSRLLETIISEQRNKKYTPLKAAEKSRIIREMIDKYTLPIS